MEKVCFGDHVPSALRLRPWCYGGCMVLCQYLTMVTRYLLSRPTQNHDNSVSIVNQYTVSIGNPMTMSIFLIYYPVYAGVFNSNVTTKSVRLHYFITECWGDKTQCPSVSKSRGRTYPLILLETRSLFRLHFADT